MSFPVLIFRYKRGTISIFTSLELTLYPIIGVQPGWADDLEALLVGTFLNCLRPEFFELISRQLDLAGYCIINADLALSFD